MSLTGYRVSKTTKGGHAYIVSFDLIRVLDVTVEVFFGERDGHLESCFRRDKRGDVLLGRREKEIVDGAQTWDSGGILTLPSRPPGVKGAWVSGRTRQTTRLLLERRCAAYILPSGLRGEHA